MRRKELFAPIYAACIAMALSVVAVGAPVTVEFWVPAKPVWMNEAVAMFEADNPNLKVNVTQLDWGNIVEKVTLAIAGGAPPDVFTYGTGGVVNFAATGMVQPVDRIAPAGLLSDMWPGFLEPARWKGQLYGIPFMGETSALLYSATKFEESGFDANRPPTTWDDLVAKARKLVRRGSDGRFTVTGYYVPIGHEHVFATFFRQLGGQHFSDDGSQALFNSDAGLQAMQFYSDLIYEHAVTDLTASSNILKGQAAMVWTNGPSGLLSMRRADATLAEGIRGAAMPWFRHRLYYTGGQTFMIPVGAKQPQAAAQFVAFATGPKVARLASAAGNFFPRQSLLKTVYGDADADLRSMIAAMEFAATSPPHPQWVQTIPEMKNQTSRVLKRETTPKEALDTLVRIVNRFIAEAAAK